MAEPARSNGYDKAALQGIVEEIEKLQREIEEEKIDCAERCRPHREAIGEILDHAKDLGMPMKELRLLLSNRKAERKIGSKIADLAPDARQIYELLEDMLGDFGSTALGKAALDKARPSPESAH